MVLKCEIAQAKLLWTDFGTPFAALFRSAAGIGSMFLSFSVELIRGVNFSNLEIKEGWDTGVKIESSCED